MKKETLLEFIGLALSESPSKNVSSSQDGTLKICILQRGWVFVGKYYEEGDDCRLEEASCIRNWGTTKGLGEIAEGGPTSNTKLDKLSKPARFHKLGMVVSLDCNEKNWK